MDYHLYTLTPTPPSDWHQETNIGDQIVFGGSNTFYYCPKCWEKKEAEKPKTKIETDINKFFRKLSNKRNSKEEHF